MRSRGTVGRISGRAVLLVIALLVVWAVAALAGEAPPSPKEESRILSEADWQSLMLLDAQIALQQERVLRFQAEADKLKLIFERSLATLAAKYETVGWRFDPERRGWVRAAPARKEGP